MTQRKWTRRSFLGVGTATVAAPLLVPSHVLGLDGATPPSETVKLGIAGLGGRAGSIVHNGNMPGGRIAAVADCFRPRCDQMAGATSKLRPDLKPETWNKYSGIREMIEKEKLDAVFVETTTHARVWCMMHAMAAGVDVYGEKPLTLTIEEGRILADAARKSGRILQTGTQQRSMPVNRFCSKLVREGAIGKIKEVIVYNYIGSSPWSPRGKQPVPGGLNWDLWTNQIELRPYHSTMHRGWTNYSDFDGGGKAWGMTGFGTHSLDQVQCALGTDDTGPVEVWLGEKGNNGWPRVMMRYANGTVLKMVGERHTLEDLGAIFRGEKGNIEILRGHARANPKELLEGAPPDTGTSSPQQSDPHFKNFLDCVRTREQPHANAEVGHRATTICHLANICRQLGRKLHWDPKAERFVNDEEANGLISRPRRAGYELPEVG